MRAKHHSSVALIAILSLWVSAAYGGSLPPGVVRQTNAVYLVENHSTAGMVWHMTGQRGATVVHLDAHDDCRFVAADKLERLDRLWKAKAWDEIFRLSDLGFVSRFKVRPEETLFDLGNFIYPCMADGTVARFIWVLPDLTLDDAARARLKGHLVSALHLKAPAFTDQDDGSFSFPLLKGTMVVTTLAALPPQPKGAILDFDIDFFAFPRALTDIHLKGDLQWDPADVCTRLEELVPAPALTTISASVYGGYLPLLFRFLADACFDRLVTGAYPVYATRHLEAVLRMRRTGAPVPLPAAPENPVYLPAHRHLAGLLKLMANEVPSALDTLDAAASALPVYSKGLLDASEALRYMGNPAAAADAITRFERRVGHRTTGSRAARAHVYRATGDLERAAAIAAELVAWNPDAHLLLLQGGILTAMDRLKEAAACYARVLVTQPQDHLALYNLATIRARQGQRAEAIELYRRATVLRSDFAAAEENLGYLLMQARRFEEACTHLKRATVIAPRKVSAWVGRGDAHAARGQNRAAADCFREVLRLEPAGPAAEHARRALKRLAAE